MRAWVSLGGRAEPMWQSAPSHAPAASLSSSSWRIRRTQRPRRGILGLPQGTLQVRWLGCEVLRVGKEGRSCALPLTQPARASSASKSRALQKAREARTPVRSSTDSSWNGRDARGSGLPSASAGSPHSAPCGHGGGVRGRASPWGFCTGLCLAGLFWLVTRVGRKRSSSVSGERPPPAPAGTGHRSPRRSPPRSPRRRRCWRRRSPAAPRQRRSRHRPRSRRPETARRLRRRCGREEASGPGRRRGRR